jgi:hypothetical protein
MKKTRHTPGQTITNQKFEQFVRQDIELYFHIKYLKDMRVQGMLDKLPFLKKEAYSLFDKSFNEILSNLGLSRSRITIFVSWYNWPYEIKGWQQVYADDKSKNIKFNIRDVLLRFDKYRMRLLERTILICNYVFYKQLWADLREAAPHLKAMTEEEKYTIPGFKKIDYYPFAQSLAQDETRQQESDKKEIWDPELKEQDGEVWIGSFYGLEMP